MFSKNCPQCGCVIERKTPSLLARSTTCSRTCGANYFKRPLRDRFAERYEVASNGCWLWSGTVSKMGYGVIAHDNRHLAAHRVAYTLHKGDIPAGLCVCHTCDTPRCVNPEHLFGGTHQDNMDDMRKKGRGNRPAGEKHWKAKLTVEDVIRIRERAETETHSLIAADYNVGRVQVGHIARGKAWKGIIK